MMRYSLTNDNGDRITVTIGEDRQITVSTTYAKPLAEDVGVEDLFRMMGWYVLDAAPVKPLHVISPKAKP